MDAQNDKLKMTFCFRKEKPLERDLFVAKDELLVFLIHPVVHF